MENHTSPLNKRIIYEIYYWKLHGVLNKNYEVCKANMKNSYVEGTGATLFFIGSSSGQAELNIITTLHLQRFSVDHVWKLSETPIITGSGAKQNQSLCWHLQKTRIEGVTWLFLLPIVWRLWSIVSRRRKDFVSHKQFASLKRLGTFKDYHCIGLKKRNFMLAPAHKPGMKSKIQTGCSWKNVMFWRASFLCFGRLFQETEDLLYHMFYDSLRLDLRSKSED